MRFITTIYGEKYVPFLWVHLWSIRNTHPEDKVSVLYDEIPKSEILILKGSFPNFDFEESKVHISELDMVKRISLRINYFLKAFELYDDKYLCFIDCDTIVLRNINNYISNDFDILFTWKNEKFVLNAGVIICRNNKESMQFMRLWLKKTIEILSDDFKLERACENYGAPDQYAFCKILKTNSYNGIIERTINGHKTKFKGIHCKYINETNCKTITEKTHIVHFKAGWHPILLEDAPFSINRPKLKCFEMYRHWIELFSLSINESLKSFIINSAKHYKDQFKRYSDGFEERGILNSEMLLICAMISAMGINIIIESGRYRGRSTEILAKFFQDTNVKIISIELLKDENADYVEKKLQSYKNVKLLYGDTNIVLPKIIFREKKSMAILFDGPKGKEAIDLFKRLLSINSNIKVGFFHDMRKALNDLPNPSRNNMEKSIFNRIFFSDDNDYVQNFKEFDEGLTFYEDEITEHSWRPYKKGEKHSSSYGPTVAVVVPFYKEISSLKNRISSPFILLRNAYNYVKIKLPSVGLNFLLKLYSKIPQYIKEKWRLMLKIS